MTVDQHAEPRSGGETPKFRYNAELAGEIELRWQARWEADGAFEVANPTPDQSAAHKKKIYILDMFPYPSGVGLHVGHPLGYIGSDVYARYKQMLGYHVLHPFGYDAFGLPAEQYALDTGQHPAITTQQNIDNMRRQLRRLGLTHDPNRELSTSDPSFYKWTQWIFLQLFNSWFDEHHQIARPIDELVTEFESGKQQPSDGSVWRDLSPTQQREAVNSYRLAYLAEAPVNWCPQLGTVLANEEVTHEGRSDIGNYPVFRRQMRQWMLRITAYADRLLEDLDPLDWTDALKTMQHNWIGRSEGAEVTFSAIDADGQSHDIMVFTTRPDTLFGATYLVLAPEHPLVDQLIASSWPSDTPAQWRPNSDDTPAEVVAAYRQQTEAKSDRERIAVGPATGAFIGATAKNPVTGEELPIFIADYVLVGYGTGSIMAVPAHDQRDFQFATARDLPIKQVVTPTDHALDSEGDSSPQSKAFEAPGVAYNSANDALSLDGLSTAEAKQWAIDWLVFSGHGQRRVAYRLRDWLFSRQRYWGEPFPIVYGDDGLPVALPESMLPVELPEMTNFQPEAGGDEPQPPLSRLKDWTRVTLDLGDGPKTYRRETNTMPQWAGSCWYYLRYLDSANNERFVDPTIEQFWMGSSDEAKIGGVDLYIGGVEHAVLHLLYARFWHKVLYDLGYVSTPEPFQRLYNQGYILAPAYTDETGRYVQADEVEERDGAFFLGDKPVTQHSGKMGKSLKNAVAPDFIYTMYGADTLRLYEMAMGPLDADRPWRTDDMVGVFRFLQRVWRNIVDEETGESRVGSDELGPGDPLYAEMHKTISSVQRLFEGLRLNVAVARLIEFNNSLTQHVAQTDKCPRNAAETLVLMLAPLAPHISAELWEQLGHDTDLATAMFPQPDMAAVVTEQATLPVTVDGKVRGEILVARDASEAEALTAANGLEAVARLIEGKTIKKTVYVPGRILNIVTK